jgi:hypothetical protein
MSLFTATDYKVASGDGTQTVTYTAKRPPSADVTDTVPYSLRYDIDRRSVLASDGAFKLEDATWELPVAELVLTGSLTPQEGDTVTESGGTVWVVKAVEKTALDTIWKLTCGKAR